MNVTSHVRIDCPLISGGEWPPEAGLLHERQNFLDELPLLNLVVHPGEQAPGYSCTGQRLEVVDDVQKVPSFIRSSLNSGFNGVGLES